MQLQCVSHHTLPWLISFSLGLCRRDTMQQMRYLTIALAILMPLLACALNSWLNIKIKFAATAEEATRETRGVLLRVVNWISNVYMVAVLVWQLTLSTPLTRLSLAAILIPSFTLFASYMLWWIGQVIDILKD